MGVIRAWAITCNGSISSMGASYNIAPTCLYRQYYSQGPGPEDVDQIVRVSLSVGLQEDMQGEPWLDHLDRYY